MIPTSDPNQGFFDKVKADQEASQEARTEETRAALEEGLIRTIFRECHITPGWTALTRLCRERTGQAGLTLEWFYDNYPGFPVRLSVAKIPWTHATTIWDLLDNFVKLPMFKQYELALATGQLDDRTETIGLVFMAGRRRLVLHNYHRGDEIGTETAPWNRGTRIVHQTDQVAYRLEPFRRLMEAVGQEWYTT